MFKNLKSIFIALVVAIGAANLTGCTRIETGEVGVRVNASKQIEPTELQPGSWNQTMFGDVLTFPVKDIALNLENKTPLTADNSALADFDVTVIYNINPNAVAELYSTKSKAFHAADKGDIILMYNYVGQIVNNAVYKSVRQYKALEVADNRQKIEQEIRTLTTQELTEQGLQNALQITTVQVRNALPNADILKSATEYVKAQNELKVKETEVAIAKKESERMAALANNSTQSVEYMRAQSQLLIAQAVKEGKVQTIIIPSNLTALGTVK